MFRMSTYTLWSYNENKISKTIRYSRYDIGKETTY